MCPDAGPQPPCPCRTAPRFCASPISHSGPGCLSGGMRSPRLVKSEVGSGACWGTSHPRLAALPTALGDTKWQEQGSQRCRPALDHLSHFTPIGAPGTARLSPELPWAGVGVVTPRASPVTGHSAWPRCVPTTSRALLAAFGAPPAPSSKWKSWPRWCQNRTRALRPRLAVGTGGHRAAVRLQGLLRGCGALRTVSAVS